MTEAAVSFKTMVSIHQTEQHHIQVECNLDINSSDNIKSHNILSQHSKIKWRKKSVHIDEVHSTCPK